MTPSTPLADAALRYARETQPDWLTHHCLRAYLFGRAVGEAGGEEFDDELLFVAALLHDLGLTDAADTGQRFEVDGADAAAAFLESAGMAASRVGVVWEAIALHTSLGLTKRSPAEVRLMQAGTMLDVAGPAAKVPPEALAALPRGDVAQRLMDVIVAQALRDPRKARPTTFAGELLRQRHPEAAGPTFAELVWK
ncbi:hypothetical protein Val02_68460 [Virgisporangium aliadipatigenens]|uniref:HD domain-containing protein n=1 Tax=Virgisporangium aliadipatigenens TaxID=741659 RepID=A0A8J4DT67_9ACTN|nr:HD domain-containing protein [Virgisporangium aliadipatigenens]GIJ49960.1 hypothetical protein Val02_68460 [Virgisporangium aliadipatigenens]